MRTLTITIAESSDGQTVKHILKTELFMADGFIARVKLRDNGILLDGVRVRTIDRVHSGQVLTVQVGDLDEKNTASPIPGPLEIVYEDDDLAVLNKPSGMAVHGTEGGPGGATVANVLAYIWGQDQAFHPVSRLDRGTSGLMVVAKSGYIHDRLRRYLHTGRYFRQYYAVTDGCPPYEGVISEPIAPDPEQPGKRVVSATGSPSVTKYKVVERKNGHALLMITPQTGRTHQIRVHLSSLGTPISGDTVYGTENILLGRPALHSAYLEFNHPVTGERKTFYVPMPEDMSMYWNGL